MIYPMSTAVVAGQAAEADQYNFLRNDALCLGGDPAASGTLRDLLYRDQAKNKSYVVQRMRRGVREAELSYRLLAEREPSIRHSLNRNQYYELE